MKKRISYALITISILLTLLLGACGGGNNASGPAEGEAPVAVSQASTEVPTEQPTSGELVSQGSGACRNDFYPIRSDKTWHYQIVDPGGARQGSFTLSYDNLAEDTFDALMSLRNPDTDEIFQARGTWFCSGEGILDSEFTTLDFASAVDVQVETLDYDGVSLLPDDQWETGAVWDSSYQLNVTFSVDELDVTSAMDVDLTNTITGIESVSVTAGSYPEAYRVETSGAMKLDMAGDMNLTMSDIPIEFTTWYVRGVGMVKQISTGPDADGSYTELVSIQ